jgi:hypothetical protein
MGILNMVHYKLANNYNRISKIGGGSYIWVRNDQGPDFDDLKISEK